LYHKGKKVEKHVTGTDFHGYGETIRNEVKRLLPSGQLKVLDVGTGFGTNVTFLAKNLPQGSKIWTIDPSSEILAEVKQKLGGAASNVEFVRASAEKLDFPDGFFDLAVSVMVFHHMKDLGAAVEEIARVTRKGGKFIVVDYKPEASHELHFQSRHVESDFFKLKDVEKAIKSHNMSLKIKDFGLWYLAEAAV
jgi:ubiquinone/menaquinone biosynthesis C-methylase UbiE